MRRAARFILCRVADILWAVATIVMICALPLLIFFFAIFTSAGVIRYAIEKGPR